MPFCHAILPLQVLSVRVLWSESDSRRIPESKLYEQELHKLGLQAIVPDAGVQSENVMKAVFGIKAGTDTHISEDLLAKAGEHLVVNGAEVIILGCTEIPLAFNPARARVPAVDATKVLTERSIKLYRELAGKE